MARPPLPPADPRTTDDRAAKRGDGHRIHWPSELAPTRTGGGNPRRQPEPVGRPDSNRSSGWGGGLPHARRPPRRRSRPALRKRACASTRRTTRGIARPVTPASQGALPAGRPTRFPRGCRSPARGRCTRGPFPDAVTGSVTTTSMDCASRAHPWPLPGRHHRNARCQNPSGRLQRPRKTPAVCASKQQSCAVSIAS